MVHMLEGMKGINLIMTYGGGTYDLHQFIPHQVLFYTVCTVCTVVRKRCAGLVLRLLHAQRGYIRRAS
jgi:hypothetical protein